MKNKPQLIALYTIVHHELMRMYRIFSQVLFPPMITTLLYFLIFGSVMGQRIGTVQGISYPEFIAPGLIMMGVITNSYSNVSSSLFLVRFQKSIEEMLVTPMHYSTLLLGYTIGGVVRGLVVGILISIIASFFVKLDFTNFLPELLIIIAVASIFSLAGFTNALLAKNFDDIAIIPTFVLTPLTYLGGVFYSTSMLPPIWQHITYFNPILYMINALRHEMVGQVEVSFALSISIIISLLLGLIILNLILLKKGIGIKNF